MNTWRRAVIFLSVLLFALGSMACNDNDPGAINGGDDDDPPGMSPTTADICDYEIHLGGDPYRCEGTAGFSGGGAGGDFITAFCEHDLACFEEDYTESDVDSCRAEIDAIRSELDDDYGSQCAQAFDHLIICANGLSCEQLWDGVGCESQEAQLDEACSAGTIEPVDPLEQAAMESCDKQFQCGMISDAEYNYCIQDVEDGLQEPIDPVCEDALLHMYACEHSLSCEMYEDYAERMELCEAQYDAVIDAC